MRRASLVLVLAAALVHPVAAAETKRDPFRPPEAFVRALERARAVRMPKAPVPQLPPPPPPTLRIPIPPPPSFPPHGGVRAESRPSFPSHREIRAQSRPSPAGAGTETGAPREPAIEVGLAGVVLGPVRVALLRLGQRIETVPEGEKVAGVRVVRVRAGEVTVRTGGRTAVIREASPAEGHAPGTRNARSRR